MNKLLALALLTLAPAAARAEVFNCSFTEPFVSFTFDTATQTIHEKNISEESSTTLTNVQFQVTAPNVFVLNGADGTQLARLELNNQGSDGMSNLVYPYAVKYARLGGGANSGIGGCESTLLKTKGQN